jgi:hypothetical protein
VQTRRAWILTALAAGTLPIPALMGQQPALQHKRHTERFVIGAASGPTEKEAQALSRALLLQFQPGAAHAPGGVPEQQHASEWKLESYFLHDIQILFRSELADIPHERTALVCLTHGSCIPAISGQPEQPGTGKLLANAVRLMGLRCDSITSVITDVSGRAFNVSCNHGSRLYQIASDGRQWTVSDKSVP